MTDRAELQITQPLPQPPEDRVADVDAPELASEKDTVESADSDVVIGEGRELQRFNLNPLAPYRGVVRRFFVVYRHVTGLLGGGLVASARVLPPSERKGFRSFWRRFGSFVVRPFVKSDIRDLPFPVQLRRRLEFLGPAYVKLGQVLAIREDLLPASVTDELTLLFDQLPEIPFRRVKTIVELSLKRPIDELFLDFDEAPLASASIAQVHRATTLGGQLVVVKVLKPGIKQNILSDLKLLQIVGVFLQWILPRYQPRRIIGEFSAYTSREIDFSYEADHAEIFAANFHDVPRIRFPQIHRDLSSREVLTMEYLDGIKPGAREMRDLPESDRKDIIDLGAAGIIRMLYRDGFFHADLHAGNLLVLPRDPVEVAFIDVGMVGRFDADTRRRMMYYFHALVSGDIEGAARYLTDLAAPGPGADPQAFRRAVGELSRRFLLRGTKGDVSIASLILQSVSLAGKYRLFFPVEMTLMVKALITFEGVGRTLDPNLDVAAATRKHVTTIFKHHFNPQELAREFMRSAPELVDFLVLAPRMLSSGMKKWDVLPEQRPVRKNRTGIRTAIIAGSCTIAGTIAAVAGSPVVLWAALFGIAALFTLFGRR